MSISKENLNNFLPNGFETENKEDYKMPFDEDLVQTGYERDVPDIVSGPNLNNLIDVIGKNTNTLNSYVEYLNSLSVNKTPIVDSNNQLNSTQIGLKVYSATETYLLNDLVTTIQDGKVHFYRSLVANNTGHDLTDKQYWEEVKLGSGSGLEVCDIGMALYVDETKGLRRYLNGQIIDINTNTQAFLNRLLKIKDTNPDYFTTEENWQTEKTMNIDGCVYKFVLNYDSTGTNVVSVRLPKYPDYVEINNNSINNTAPVAVYGNGRGLGLVDSVNSPTYRTLIDYSYPNNIEGLVPGNLTFDHNTVFPVGTNTSNQSGYIRNVFWGVSQNANTSGLTGTATITSNFRQTKLKMRYFIQIATGQETENNITNEIELNTPSFFGDSKYVPTKVNNLSWLKSEGQSNPKGTYPSFYDWILENVNKGTKNFKGKKLYQFKGNTTETEVYTPSCSTRNPVVGTWFYGYSPIQPFGYVTQVNSDGSIVIHDTKVNKDFTLVYKQEIITLPNLLTDYDFYIDTDNETFRLPLLDGSEDLPSDEVLDWTSYVTATELDLPAAPYNGYLSFFGNTTATIGYIYNKTAHFGQGSGQTTAQIFRRDTIFLKKGDSSHIFISNVNGIESLKFIKAQGNGSLYFYVGETVQNANLIDAGRIGEQLADKVNLDLANLSSEGKEAMTAYWIASGSPNINIPINLTISTTTQYWEAPSNGHVWFYMASASSGAVGFIGVKEEYPDLWSIGNIGRGWLYINKGQHLSVRTDVGTITLGALHFIAKQ